MKTVELRKLAFGSLIKFGDHRDKTVQQVIDLGFEGVKDLQKMYFKLSRISFLPDVLDAIRIYPELRIEKPGKCPEAYKKAVGVWLQERFDGLEGKDLVRERTKAKFKRKKIRSAEAKSAIERGKSRGNRGISGINPMKF